MELIQSSRLSRSSPFHIKLTTIFGTGQSSKQIPGYAAPRPTKTNENGGYTPLQVGQIASVPPLGGSDTVNGFPVGRRQLHPWNRFQIGRVLWLLSDVRSHLVVVGNRFVPLRWQLRPGRRMLTNDG
jgi:hypothetical protein